MARPIEQELYRLLMESQLNFLGNHEYPLTQIYELVKNQYPELCDDTYLCKVHCSKGGNVPEWNHVVRTVLQSLKDNGIAIRISHGVWGFDH